MIVFGCVFGRWWKASVPVGAIVWVSILLADGSNPDVGTIVGATLLGAANAAFGAALYLVAASLVRITRRSREQS